MVSLNGPTIGLRITTSESDPLVADFLEVANQFMRLLSEIDIAVSSSRRRTVDWALRTLSYGSPVLLTAEPSVREYQEDNRMAILDATIQGLTSLQESDSRPRFFSDQALSSARGLVRVLGDRVDAIEVFSDGQNLSCDESIATNVRAILRPGYDILGTIEGTLEALNSHSGFRFAVYEPVAGIRIECEVANNANQELRQQIIGLYERRVRVSGTLRTNAKGDVRSARISEIYELRSEPQLTSVEDISGLYDITAGLDAEEYIRNMRDA